DAALAAVLAPPVCGWFGVWHRAKDRELRILDRCRVAARGRLHRCDGEDLHQVVDDDVPKCPDGVIEMAAIADTEALGQRDLHARDVMPIPNGLDQGVREAQ